MQNQLLIYRKGESSKTERKANLVLDKLCVEIVQSNQHKKADSQQVPTLQQIDQILSSKLNILDIPYFHGHIQFGQPTKKTQDKVINSST